MLWTLGGSVIFSASQWSMLMVLAKLGSKSDVGSYGLGLAVTSPVFLLLSLPLRGAQATERSSSPYQFSHYFTLRSILLVVSLVVCMVYALLSNSVLAPIIGWLALSKVFDGLSDVCYGHWQAGGHLRQVAIAGGIRGLLSALFLAIAFALTHQVSWAAFGVAVGYLLGLVSYDFPNTRRQVRSAWLNFNGSMLLPLVKLTWLLSIAIGLISLNANLPRYFLSHERGLEAVGLFVALSYVTTAGTMVVVALGQAATTPLSRLAEQSAASRLSTRSAFWKLLSRLLLTGVGIGVLGVLGAWLLGGWLLGLLYGPSYAQAAPLFTLLMAAAGVSYVASFTGFGMTALRQFNAQAPLFLATTAVLLLSCWWLIPSNGLRGAAWALLISSVVQLIGGLWIIWWALKQSELSVTTLKA